MRRILVGVDGSACSANMRIFSLSGREMAASLRFASGASRRNYSTTRTFRFFWYQRRRDD
jgi:hypothetical protein